MWSLVGCSGEGSPMKCPRWPKMPANVKNVPKDIAVMTIKTSVLPRAETASRMVFPVWFEANVL